MARTFLYLEEVARECRTSLSSVRVWISSGRLRATRPGRRLLISREDLELFLNSSVRGPKRPAVGAIVDLEPDHARSAEPDSRQRTLSFDASDRKPGEGHGA